MLKTYSRGRAAVAAANKALTNIEAFVASIEPIMEGHKFTALVEVKAGGGKEITDAVKAAGFRAVLMDRTLAEQGVSVDPAPEITTEIPILAEPSKPLSELFDDEFPETEDDGDEPDLEDTVSEMLDDMGEDVGEPLTAVAPKGRGGYINEVSSTMGACELARSIANQMPDAPRKEVIAACRQAGIAYGTARTQIQKVRGGK